MLLETISMFEEWLSPDVMELLVAEYADSSPAFGKLKWEYAPLPANVWGQFVAMYEKLYVNRYKTKGLFSQQVQTILHEIQHWNQFLKVAEDAKITNHRDAVREWDRQYRSESDRRGYHNNKFEVDARAFSEQQLDAAISKLSKHYGGKVEGGSFEQAIDELFDEYSDEPFITRAQIGQTLKAHDVNSSDNMKRALVMFADLGMKVR